MTEDIHVKALPSGALIPKIGLGVYRCAPGEETYKSVLNALQIGYRHIDTAQCYNNESDVGRAVQDSKIPRQEIFLTTKLWITNFGYGKAIEATKESLERLASGSYIDLLLLHAPGDKLLRAETWSALEQLMADGVVRDIGVSNFGQAHLEKLLATAKVRPCVNQIELHPWMTRTTLVSFCKEHDILLEAYSPLAKASNLQDPVVQAIANEIKATAAQVLIAWSLAKGFITIPKSSHPTRQQENLDAIKIHLTADQIMRLDALDEYLVTGWDPIKEHAV